jgi:hypothetical protein
MSVASPMSVSEYCLSRHGLATSEIKTLDFLLFVDAQYIFHLSNFSFLALNNGLWQNMNVNLHCTSSQKRKVMKINIIFADKNGFYFQLSLNRFANAEYILFYILNIAIVLSM